VCEGLSFHLLEAFLGFKLVEFFKKHLRSQRGLAGRFKES
jgi:hypothetical protein